MIRELQHPVDMWIRALVVIGVVFTVIALARARRMSPRDAIKVSFAEALFVASLATIWAFTIVRRTGLVPGADGMPLHANLVPLIPIFQDLMSFERQIAAVNAIGNIVLFVPFGAAAVWQFDVDPWRVVLLGVLISTTIEAWQSLPSTGRYGDINDVILNGLGTLVGAFGMVWLLRVRPGLAIGPSTLGLHSILDRVVPPRQ